MRAWFFVGVLAVIRCASPAPQLETSTTAVADGGPGTDAGLVDAGPAELPPTVTSTGCWSKPIVLAPAFTWIAGSMVVRPDGTALVAWVENTATMRVLSRRVFPDGGVSAPEVIYGAPEGPAQLNYDLRLRSGGGGAAVLSWTHQGDAGTVNELLLSVRPLDAGWQPIERVNSVLSEPILWADVQPDRSGQHFAAWKQSGVAGSPRGLHFRRYVPDGGWSAQATVTPPDTFLVDSPTLAVSEDGHAVLAWQGHHAPTYEPELHATSLHTEPWVDTRLSFVDSRTTAPALALAQGGGGIVAWTRDAYGASREVRVARLLSGAWLPSERVGPADGGVVVLPPVASLDDVGRASIHWASMESDDLVLASRDDGSGWSIPVVLDSVQQTRFLLHASNGRGRELVAWSRDASLVVQRTEMDAGVTDVLNGLMVGSNMPPVIFVGESGARWILANVSEEGWRAVAMFCP